MRKLVLALGWIALSVLASAQSAREVVAQDLGGLLDVAALRGAIVSVQVTRPNGQVIFARQADIRVMPASNQKILSTLYALDRLGSNYRFRTRFWREGSQIIVDAPGDPTLTLKQVNQVRTQLGPEAVTSVAVRQAFRPGWPPGWEWDDLAAAYAPIISALTVDRGVFRLESEACALLPLPAALGVEVVLDRNAPAGVARYDAFTHRLATNGPFPAPHATLGSFTLPSPDATVAALLGGPLAEVNQVPTRPADAEIVSEPLLKIIGECLTVSDNLYAECLLMAGASAEGPLSRSAYPEATKRLTNWLVKEVKVPAGEFRISDGSGLSRHNLVTVRGVSQVLRWAAARPWGKAYREAMATPGQGTLRTRLAGSAFRGKTGTLDLVVALSGYVPRPNGELWTLSAVVNHGLGGSASIRTVVDALVQRLER